MAIQQNLRDQTLTKIKEVVNNNKVSKSRYKYKYYVDIFREIKIPSHKQKYSYLYCIKKI